MVSKWFAERLLRDTQGAKSVVDYGCGDCRHLAMLPSTMSRVGVDLVHHGPPPEGVVLITADIRSVSETADVALLVDVIEHLEKSDGLRLVDELKKRHKTIIVFTPKGFWDNKDGEAAYPDNPLQKHLSGWEPEDLPGFDIDITTKYGPAPETIYGVWKR